MSTSGNWIRGRPSGGIRQVNVRYEISDPQWRDIEDYVERIPFKQVNRDLLKALLVGSKILLDRSGVQVGVDIPASVETSAQQAPSTKPAAVPAIAGPQGTGAWVRAVRTSGLRPLNIRYSVDDKTWQSIEDLLERVPYKKVNHVMRYALLLGSKIMLEGYDPSKSLAAGDSRPKSPLPQPQAAPPSPAPTSDDPAPMSAAARNMFSQYG